MMSGRIKCNPEDSSWVARNKKHQKMVKVRSQATDAQVDVTALTLELCCRTS